MEEKGFPVASSTLLTVLRPYLIVNGPGRCFYGRVCGCKWMQISKEVTEWMRRKWPRCQEPDCKTEPGTHRCAGGRLICCKHAFRFEYYHEHWIAPDRGCVCKFQSIPEPKYGPLWRFEVYFRFTPVSAAMDVSCNPIMSAFHVDIFDMAGCYEQTFTFPAWAQMTYTDEYCTAISRDDAVMKMHFMRYFQTQVDRRIIYARTRIVALTAEPVRETCRLLTDSNSNSDNDVDYGDHDTGYEEENERKQQEEIDFMIWLAEQEQ